MLLIFAWACVPTPVPVEVTAGDWARSLPMDSPLAVACADASGGDGRWTVVVDDRSGVAALAEIGSSRVFLRDAFGVVPDRCWWVPLGPEPMLPVGDCVREYGEDGTCSPDAPAGFRWFTPGTRESDTPFESLAAGSGQLVLADADTITTVDLTPDATAVVETPRTWLQILSRSALPSPGAKHWAATTDGWAAWDAEDGSLSVLGPRPAAPAADTVSAQKGPGILTARGDRAALITAGTLRRWTTLTDRADRRSTGQDAPSDAVILDDGTVVALFGDTAIAFGETTRSWEVAGAEGLVVTQTSAYAWGNVDGHGRMWRLGDPGVSTDIDRMILGAGTGTSSSELILVLAGDAGPTVRGFLDQAVLDATPDGTVGLALAAFVESPRDTDLTNVRSATTELEEGGGCPFATPDGLDRETAFCCAQWRRGERLEQQLDWLEPRLDPTWPGGPAAVVLGVNPSSVAQSRLCLQYSELAQMGDRLPTVIAERLADWEARGVGSAAILGHSEPKDPNAWWVRCPDEWPSGTPRRECWDVSVDTAELQHFWQAATDAASLAPWGAEPDWRLFGGPFDGAVASDGDWTSVFPNLNLPDGDPPDALFFGSLAMNPSISRSLSKEMAPADVRRRAEAIPIGTPGERWDAADEGPIDYIPGVTYAMPYLYESRRSGLLFSDWVGLVSPGADFTTPAFPADESPATMNAADFAAAEQYLAAHVIAVGDPTRRRWTYLHLQDVSRVNTRSLADGWVDCGVDCTDTALDDFLVRMSDYGPGVVWRPAP